MAVTACMRRAAILACLLAGCISSDVVVCGDVVCDPGQACAPSGNGCAFPEQLEGCKGLDEGTACTFGSTAGACRGGVCLAVNCGNGVQDPGEACDDGNRDSGDGCSATCTSDETCGNGMLDGAKG